MKNGWLHPSLRLHDNQKTVEEEKSSDWSIIYKYPTSLLFCLFPVGQEAVRAPPPPHQQGNQLQGGA